VKATALDSKRNNFETEVIVDACRGISENSIETAFQELEKAGVTIKKSSQALSELSASSSNNDKKNLPMDEYSRL